ncbi:hypothetical protein T440DRAFT_206770 [Plenodomus tracheiphilus IPT5]|uniref:Uncharacterized protein n=1 Tax=Plenodomus tracheiphilus IPT5 TaxID=1408161 RepID=A0A6A7BJ25_9PLEO|nr:hypothetical protein T440DRAFT_206770 [Plenodomus tracheiphilus IPT5]
MVWVHERYLSSFVFYFPFFLYTCGPSASSKYLIFGISARRSIGAGGAGMPTGLHTALTSAAGLEYGSVHNECYEFFDLARRTLLIGEVRGILALECFSPRSLHVYNTFVFIFFEGCFNRTASETYPAHLPTCEVFCD